jgi:hypothetical protein
MTVRSGAKHFMGAAVLVAALGIASIFGTFLVTTVDVSRAGASEAHATICGVEGRVTAFRILRSSVRNPTRFSFPKSDYVNNASSSRSVARALCALPKPGTGVINCSAGTGPNYTLTFVAPKYQIAHVLLQLRQCGIVTGLATERTVSRSPGFWRTLGRAMKLKNATGDTFEGQPID